MVDYDVPSIDFTVYLRMQESQTESKFQKKTFQGTMRLKRAFVRNFEDFSCEVDL